jgi:hypothetical protein
MENDKVIVNVECPNCKAGLSFAYMDGIENAMISCAKCKMKLPFKSFNIVERTKYVPITPVMGQLLVVSTGERYDLREGEFIVGRKGKEKTSDVQLDVTDRTMSRLHLKMNVTKIGNNMLHRVSNAENKRPTLINAQEIQDGDIIMLRYGDTLKMGETYVRFVKPEG